MKVYGVFQYPDERPEATGICEFCGKMEPYVFGWTEPLENAEKYFKEMTCSRCGRKSEEYES